MTRTLLRQEQVRSRRLRSPGLGLVIALYVVPTALLIAYSFLTPGSGGGVEWTVSLDSYRELVRHDPRADYYNGYVTVMIRSIVWSAIATAMTLTLALPVASFISRRRQRFVKHLLLAAVITPFFTSMVVRLHALRYLLANTGPLNNGLEAIGLERRIFLNSSGAVVAGLVYTALPFMIVPVYAAVERVDRDLLDAARDLGAGPLVLFRTTFMPLIRAGVATGATLVFVLSLGQFLVPTLLGGGKANMVANVLEHQFGDGQNWPLGAAIASVLTAVIVLALRVRSRHDEALL